MRTVIILLALLVGACTSPSSYIDNPSTGNADNSDIIDYIDKRLREEYYWLDEVEQKSASFNRRLPWDSYLDDALSKLTTNEDDGYYTSKGQRVYYSYISELSRDTRSEVTGFGIDLHYTIAVVDKDSQSYGFIIENVFPDSPAAKAGVRRGDIIVMYNNDYINASNYQIYFNGIQMNTASTLKLQIRRRAVDIGEESIFSVNLDKGSYDETVVMHSEVIEVEGSDKKIGYLVYTGFDSEYDDALVDALRDFAAESVDDVILDLRCNSGGAVSSVVTLCSALVPQSYEDGVLCSLVRNPRNNRENTSVFKLEDAGSILNLQRLTVICSGYSASASELVVMGLRGLDFPVMLIGSTTQGKNCGMDVTRRTVGNRYLEYAPITFMCLNAKGFGDWGEGIVPDINLTEENSFGVSDKNYPLPAADWGDVGYDIALAVAVAEITGKSVTMSASGTRAEDAAMDVAAYVDMPIEGLRLYCDQM
ncbi:MAG: hypothetical protein II288_01250 [Alistipes sp.]|nr:hypothetical protein [Alistipes sp.]